MSLRGVGLRYPDRLAAMARALAHRGPDGEGRVAHERAGLGACRLAIIDRVGGDQPFRSPDGSVWMVCNGEIYNAPALRRQASNWGYPFRSRTDIETVVPLYERWGPDGIRHLDGMFGLAIWDDGRARLVLARDRAGEKPLFWSEVGGELRFASEIQALLTYPDQARCVDREAAACYASLGYVPAPRTLWEGIQKVPAAHVLVADAAGVSVRPFWDAAVAAAQPSRLASASQLRETLLRAVERELVSDVPVGVFTSGGLDSSLLVAAAARLVPAEQIHTYTVRFPDRRYDESPHAAAVARATRTIHHVVTADDAALARALGAVTSTLAEPIGDPAILPLYLLSQAARAEVRVVLSGEGADELFGGYPTYLGHQAAAFYHRLPGALRRLFTSAARLAPGAFGNVTLGFLLREFVAAAERPPLARHLQWFGALGPRPETLVELGARLAAFPATESVNRALWLDFVTYLPDNLLAKVDRGTMLASVEARAPYLDREVLELVLPAPAGFKVRGFATKVILREAARGLVPGAVIRRRKRGLSVPVADWLNTGLAPVADRLFAAQRPARRVAGLWAEHRAGRANHARKLWPIFVAELWAERWGVTVPENAWA